MTVIVGKPHRRSVGCPSVNPRVERKGANEIIPARIEEAAGVTKEEVAGRYWWGSISDTNVRCVSVGKTGETVSGGSHRRFCGRVKTGWRFFPLPTSLIVSEVGIVR